MSLKILLTQSESALASALLHELERESFNLLMPKVSELDWSKEGSLEAYLQFKKPDLVLNCRGWEQLIGGQDGAAFVASAQRLAQACVVAEVPVIHFSSYQVFGAENKVTHSEKDQVAPLNEIGRLLVAAEEQIKALPKHIILRLSWVIGAYGDNLLTRSLAALFDGAELTSNRRLRGAPTALSDVARVIVALIKQINCGAENWGVVHYCASDACNQEEFSEQLLQLLIQQQLLTAEPRLQGEPISAILGCRRLRDHFGVQARSWRPSLLPLVKQWLHNRNA
jgi:dTDP-4-dehydrorhamnose reductase